MKRGYLDIRGKGYYCSKLKRAKLKTKKLKRRKNVFTKTRKVAVTAILGMPNHLFNFLFKSSECRQMKILNARISEWPHLMLQH